MPRMTPDALAEFLQQPNFGVIATLRRDGRPYTVPVLWLWEADAAAPVFQAGRHVYPGGCIWLTGTTSRIWCRHLLADPRASLCIESGPPDTGHVGIDGTCEALLATDHDIWPMTRRLLEKFPDPAMPTTQSSVDLHLAGMRHEPRLLFRMRAEVLRAIDMRVYRGKRDDRP